MAVPSWQRLCQQPIDLARAERPPGALMAETAGAVPSLRDAARGLVQQITQREEFDPFTYAAHAGLGRLLGAAQCDPVATGLQWLKAGAHAHSADEVETVAQGIAAARAASGDGTQFDTALCGYVGHGFSTTEQLTATEAGGVECGLDQAPAPE